MGVLDEATLARLRAALDDQRDNLRKEIIEQGADPDSDDAAIDVERGFADSAQSTAEERLEALPWAILCISCKQKGIGR
ncbi:MAG: TraR/DksA C4-type zinc finger protein [Actinobacteria bacterium]|nr:TraR/DksA C4-type zinc finger protein [Actinomycetota bacterium]